MATLSARHIFAADTRATPRLAFLATCGKEQGVHVFAMSDTRWRQLHFVPSESPVSLALHPNGETLYVLNGVSEYRGLPLGTVEAFRVSRMTGELSLLHRQPLALSATQPRHMAVSPDGKTLAVAVDGGGSYNVLPILSDGSLRRVARSWKETGSGPVAKFQSAPHPQTIVYDSTDTRLITTDLGCDRLSVFSLGKSAIELATHTRKDL
ncbi:MAG TPA: beta-propeller fold lactonase family protein, partial [Acidobacteriaceae bacterium]|nr:beta-propeller fold lactonase family protein [Acidobacteriaceae bacterium]